MPARPRIAVVSPFLDTRHGTERCIVEQAVRLARDYGYDVHLYCQRVEDMACAPAEDNHEATLTGGARPASSDASQTGPSGKIVWHRVGEIRGPYVLQFLWWFFANQRQRRRDQKRQGIHFDLVYSPGINCRDANAISVHVVFSELYRLVGPELKLRGSPLQHWPRLLHRRLYYWLLIWLEKMIYSNPGVALCTVSRGVAEILRRDFSRTDVPVIYHGVDGKQFNPAVTRQQRADARRRLGLAGADFVLLLIGNGWKNKGLSCLLEAAARCLDLPVKILIVGEDDRTPYDHTIEKYGLRGRVKFSEPVADVARLYAAADAYVAPSLNDSYAMPVAEAMACGLPVIVSRRAGVSELIREDEDGLLLDDPKNVAGLAQLIRHVASHPDRAQHLGENASRTMREWSWDRNARELHTFLQCIRTRSENKSPR